MVASSFVCQYGRACHVADAELQLMQACVSSFIDASVCQLQAMVATQSLSRLSSSIR